MLTSVAAVVICSAIKINIVSPESCLVFLVPSCLGVILQDLFSTAG